MKKNLLIFFIFLTFQAFPQDFSAKAQPQKNLAAVYINAEDFGPAVEKIVVQAQNFYSQKQIDENYDDFKISKVLFLKNAGAGFSRGEWTFTSVFVSDENGEKIDGKSNFITFLHEIKPVEHGDYENDFDNDSFAEEISNLNPFTGAIASKKFRNLYGYKIENEALNLKITKVSAYICPEAAKFKFGKSEYTFENQDFSQQPQDKKSESEKSGGEQKENEKITMNYAYFLPENSKSEKVPLILWFHGLNEGGNDIYSLLLNVKTTSLAGEKIQGHFKNGAAVLAPQAPSSWLEAEDKGAFGLHYWTPVDKDGAVKTAGKIIKTPFSKLENLFGNLIVSEDASDPEKEMEKFSSEIESGKKPFAAVSLFSRPVKKLLDDFLDSNPQIDRKRIYVGGASAGGYMTVNMAIQYPDTFAAFFPVCEYYLDSKISDEKIKSLSKKPLWFTYAKNDKTVNPGKNSIPTIERLKKAGAGNLHVSVYDKVEWNKITYKGHYSWIYLFNDACEENGIKLFDWLNLNSLD